MLMECFEALRESLSMVAFLETLTLIGLIGYLSASDVCILELAPQPDPLAYWLVPWPDLRQFNLTKINMKEMPTVGPTYRQKRTSIQFNCKINELKINHYHVKECILDGISKLEGYKRAKDVDP
jgi:hypothetical protein